MFLGYPAMEYGSADELVVRTGANLLSVDYRLFPEHTPAQAFDDCVNSYLWLIESKGYKSSQIILFGCSGGGMATLFTGLQIALRKLSNPAGIFVGAPGVGVGTILMDDKDAWINLDSWKRDADTDCDALIDTSLLLTETFTTFIHFHKDYYLSSLEHAKNLAPAIVQYGGLEALGSESQMIFDHLKNQGAPVTLIKSEGLGHCYAMFLDTLEGNALFNRLIDWFILRWNN